MKLAMPLGLRAAHEEAFLDDLTVPDRVKPDFIETHAFLALWRDLSLKANDELIAVHVGTLNLELCTSWFAFHHSPFPSTALRPLSSAISPVIGPRLTMSSDQNFLPAASSSPFAHMSVKLSPVLVYS